LGGLRPRHREEGGISGSLKGDFLALSKREKIKFKKETRKKKGKEMKALRNDGITQKKSPSEKGRFFLNEPEGRQVHRQDRQEKGGRTMSKREGLRILGGYKAYYKGEGGATIGKKSCKALKTYFC